MKKNKDITMEDFENKKIIITSGKGGVGKSTIGSQVIAPYLFDKTNKKINYYELDPVNNIAATYSKSNILDISSIDPKNEDDIIEALVKREPAVFDTGGNLASQQSIQAIADSGMTDNTCWIIPISDGEEDAIVANETHNFILTLIPDAKIFFALTRAISSKVDEAKEQFVFIFGHKHLEVEWSLSEFIDLENYLVMESFSSFNLSKVLQKTIYELSDKKILEENDKKRKALIEKRETIDRETPDFEKNIALIETELREITKKGSLYKKFQRYTNTTLKPMFIKLDSFMN